MLKFFYDDFSHLNDFPLKQRRQRRHRKRTKAHMCEYEI